MDNRISRRRFLELAAMAGGTLVVGGIGLKEAEKIVQAGQRPNQKKPLLFGGGMIWAKWLDKGKMTWDYDEKEMAAFKAIGGTHTGASFDWCDLEKVKGKWDWSYMDHVVEAAHKIGLSQGGYIGNTTPWALPAGIKPDLGYRNPPRDECIPDFQNYCRMVAKRYKGKVDRFGFWNEPNGCSWINDGCSNGNMYESYTKWLKIAYKALKEGNPKCVVAGASIDYNAGVKDGYKYIEGMYKCGAKGYFDAISIHPYGEPLHWEALADTRRVMVENGDRKKGIWITEWGYNNSRGEDAAKKLKEVLTKLQTPKYSYVTLANYLCITDLPIENSEQYGLMNRKLELRPIAKAFKQMAMGK